MIQKIRNNYTDAIEDVDSDIRLPLRQGCEELAEKYYIRCTKAGTVELFDKKQWKPVGASVVWKDITADVLVAYHHGQLMDGSSVAAHTNTRYRFITEALMLEGMRMRLLKIERRDRG